MILHQDKKNFDFKNFRPMQILFGNQDFHFSLNSHSRDSLSQNPTLKTHYRRRRRLPPAATPPSQCPQSAPGTSSTLLPLLPALLRAQPLLLHMSFLASKLFDFSPNHSLYLSSFQGSLPYSSTLNRTSSFTGHLRLRRKRFSLHFPLDSAFKDVAEFRDILDL